MDDVDRLWQLYLQSRQHLLVQHDSNRSPVIMARVAMDDAKAALEVWKIEQAQR